MTSHQSTISIMQELDADRPIIPMCSGSNCFPQMEVRELSLGSIMGDDIVLQLKAQKDFSQNLLKPLDKKVLVYNNI